MVPGEPWLLVGAHLDTVPDARPAPRTTRPGIGVLLATAEALAGRRTRLPGRAGRLRRPRSRAGRSTTDHHYGSRAYVASLTPAERRSLRGMVALDRVGVGDVGARRQRPRQTYPYATELAVADRLAEVAGSRPPPDRAGERSSDHWSLFAQEGLPGVRLGSTPYAGYHSPDDVPAVVDPAQLERTSRLVVAWLR